MTGDADIRVLREMGITHREFFRVLPRLVGESRVVVKGSRVVIPEHDKRIEIVLHPERRRRIGPTFDMPVTPVELCFFGHDEAAAASFLARFDHHFFRGGG